MSERPPVGPAPTTGAAASATPATGLSREIDPLRPDWFWQLSRMIARLGVTFLFDLKVYGAQNVPSTGGVLLLPNHQSYLDPVLIGVYLRRPMSYLARHGLFDNPRFAWLIRRLRAFPVRQGAGDVGAVKEMVRRLKEGHAISMWPEGSRTADGQIGAIEPGAALVIRRAGVPAVPVAIDGSFEAWPKWKKMFRPHPIRVMYGPPMNLAGMKADEITRTIDQTLRQLLAELRNRNDTR
jgi:1-acyl-sn-glycerol-3-phosphate acyltransferase